MNMDKGRQPVDRPCIAVISINCLFTKCPQSQNISNDQPLATSSPSSSVLPIFGAEQLLINLRAQGLILNVVAPSEGAERLMEEVKADDGLKGMLRGVHLKRWSSANKHGGNLMEDGLGVGTESLLSMVEVVAAASSRSNGNIGDQHEKEGHAGNGQACFQKEGGETYLAIGERGCGDGGGGLIAEVIRWPSALSSQVPQTPPTTSSSSTSVSSQQFDVLMDIDLERLGLSKFVVDGQNPPFLFPRDYEKQPAMARMIEARWWDPHHGQLNVILGRGVSPDNVLNVIESETHKMEGK